MPKLIKNRRIIEDPRPIVFLGEEETAATITLPAGGVIVPVAVWLAQAAQLQGRAHTGIWLTPEDDPESALQALPHVDTVAVQLPRFADGRAYSTAVLLRQRHGYRGELRAFGDVLRDQFNYLSRCGFDALQPASDRYNDAQLEAAIASIDDFSEPYQASVTPAEPLFRRYHRAA